MSRIDPATLTLCLLKLLLQQERQQVQQRELNRDLAKELTGANFFQNLQISITETRKKTSNASRLGTGKSCNTCRRYIKDIHRPNKSDGHVANQTTREQQDAWFSCRTTL